MSKISPDLSRRSALPVRIRTTLTFAGLLGMLACGGTGSPTLSTGGGGGGTGGGGGGGSQNVLPCTFAAPNAGGTTSGAGVGTTVSAQYFGMHVSAPNDPWPSSLIPNFQIGDQRLWDAGVAWSQINTSSGVYDWSGLDNWLSDDQMHGTDALYNLARTPTWASSSPNDSSCTNADTNGSGQCDPPVDLNADGSGSDDVWIGWVTAIAQHSQSKKSAGGTGISYYEIWNEWNAPVFWNPANSTTPQLVRMEQDARCVIEGPPAGKSCNPDSVFPDGTAIDPTAKIVSPSPVGAHSTLDAVAKNLSTYLQTQVNGNPGGSFSDVIGFHGYVGTGTATSTSAVPCPVAEDVNTVIADMNSTLSSYSFASGKPLFNTEGGWSKALYEGFTDEDEQAAFLPRYLLLQESANVSRVYWYLWDSNVLGALYDDSTGKATKAATAYGEVSKWTVDATVSKACSANGTIWTCGFTRPSYSALAVWDAGQDCTAASCPTTTFGVPSGGYIEYRDVAGNVTSMNGASSLQIGAKPILLETAPLP
ncbi:MAG TPA: hypothetical protein VHW45_13000 [Candidatus Sulfotelmatobacter sp.]|nr:hypothetical protein [Candidatus Sulfotelmatobacter sp.]